MYLQEQLFKEHNMPPPTNLRQTVESLAACVPQRPGHLVDLDVDCGDDAADSGNELMSEDEAEPVTADDQTTSGTNSRAARVKRRAKKLRCNTEHPGSESGQGSVPGAGPSLPAPTRRKSRNVPAPKTTVSETDTQTEAIGTGETSTHVRLLF